MSEGERTAALHRLCAMIGSQADGEQTDGELLERYASRQEAPAFAALVRRHGPMVFGLCRRVLRDHHEAEDAFQATFLVLVRKAAALERHRPLGSWLYTIAYHAALKTRANAAQRLLREARVARTDCIEPPDEPAGLELRQVLDAELNRLPEKYRAPLVLCYLQGRTNEEAAMELGWPSGTVKGRLARARALLRDRLTRRGLALSIPILAVRLAEQASAASLPAGLVERITETSAAGVWATNIANGVLRAMLITKLTMGAGLLLASVLVVTAFGILLRHAGAEPSAIQLPTPDKPKVKAPAPGLFPEAKGAHLPLDPTNGASILNDNVVRPVVMLGVIPAKEQPAPAEVVEAFSENRLEIVGPKAGSAVFLLAVSPTLNSGEHANLELLTRDGKVFTLVMNVWQDDAPRNRNVITRKVFNVPLGALEAGKYEFRLVRRLMWKAFAKGSPWYQFQSATTGTVPFTVATEKDNEVGKPILLQEDSLREPKEKPQGMGSFHQFPPPTRYEISPAGNLGAPPLGLRVGALAQAKWVPEMPLTLAGLPQLREPTASEPVYAAILSPFLNSLEWMSLRAIDWKDNEVILHMDVWQDNGSRTSNVITAHYLLIPLQTPGTAVDGKWQTARGDYRVKVVWTFLRANDYPRPGEPYYPQDSARVGENDHFKQLLAGSAAKFRIPPGDKKDRESSDK